MMNKENCKGYSLTQLIFVIAIIGILTSIAYPSYQKYIRDSEIRQALAALVESAQFMERFISRMVVSRKLLQRGLICLTLGV